MDEAHKEGVVIDTHILEKELGIPVVEAVSTIGKGIEELKEKIKLYGNRL
jgi:Fe2+ transport system protein B